MNAGWVANRGVRCFDLIRIIEIWGALEHYLRICILVCKFAKFVQICTNNLYNLYKIVCIVQSYLISYNCNKNCNFANFCTYFLQNCKQFMQKIWPLRGLGDLRGSRWWCVNVLLRGIWKKWQLIILNFMSAENNLFLRVLLVL